MQIFSKFARVFRMFWDGLTKFVFEIRKRRVHAWAAFYYIGIWSLLEPAITFFGFSEQTITIIRNFGISIYPLVLTLVWFHGEEGSQRFSKVEGIALTLSLIVSVFFYQNLSKKAPQVYTVISPLEATQEKWFRENILKDFEQNHKIKINLESFDNDYEGELFNFLASHKDTSNVLLIKAPLQYTGILLNQEEPFLVSFEDVLNKDLSKNNERLQELLQSLDDTAVQFGRNEIGDGELYYLPSEFQCNVLVYLKSKVEEAYENWQGHKKTLDSTFYSVTGQNLPINYELESNPNMWDLYDLFVVSWYWANKTYGGQTMPRFAIPCARDFHSFSYITDKALCQGASLEQIFALPANMFVLAATVMQPVEPISEAFFWDAVFKRAGLFYKGLWFGEGLRSREIAKGLKLQKIFMAYLSNTRVAEVVDSNSDVGIASLPRGVSVSGTPVSKAGFSNIWYWSIPKSSPSYELSWRLAKWLLRKENQKMLRDKFLAIPTNKQLLAKEKHGSPPDSLLWSALIAQIDNNQKNLGGPVNPYKDYHQVDYEISIKFFYQKWHDIVNLNEFASQKNEVDPAAIKSTLILPVVSQK